MKFVACSHCQPRNKIRARQSGVTLVLALLVLAMVAGMATWLAEDFALTIRRSGNRLHIAQGQHYLQGAEALARYGLAEDLRTSETDHLGERWAAPQIPFDVEGGWIVLSMHDEQGRLNVNNLVQKVSGNSAAKGQAKKFTPAQRRFIRLLQTWEENPVGVQEAIAITEALIDWLDRDDEETGFGGAEALFYRNEGYLPANREMQSVSELRLVRGITPEIYWQLRQHVCALPVGSALNLNTASVHVLRTLGYIGSLEPLTESEGLELLQLRGDKGFSDLDAFYSSTVLTEQKIKGELSSDGLALNSSFFVLHAEAMIAGRHSFSNSLLQRNQEHVRVIQRRLGKEIL